jgi:hypothetical protein
MPSKILKGSQLKAFRHAVARLKDMGLVSKRVDARSQRSTRYMREQVEKRFAKVLSGEAVAVKVPRRKFLEGFKEGFDVKGRSVIIPVEPGAKRPHFSKSTGTISGEVELNGRQFKRIYTPVTADKAHKLARGKNIRYTIPIGAGFHSEDTWEDMVAFMFPYTTAGGKEKNPYNTWQKYILIDEFGTDESDNEI